MLVGAFLVGRRALPALRLAPLRPSARMLVGGEAAALSDVSSTILAFADQADNLAGPLFASSLLPYLVFLYFICQDVNGLSTTAKAGFTTLLSFVLATVIASIVAKTQYGTTLANVDFA